MDVEQRALVLGHAPCQVVDIDVFTPQHNLVARNARNVEQVVDETAQAVHLPADKNLKGC